MGFRLTFLVGVMTIAASPASAQAFSIAAEIVQGCGLVGSPSVSGIDFGTLAFGSRPAVMSGPVHAASTAQGGGLVQLDCTAGTTLQVSVGAGQHASGTQRRLGLNDGNTYLVPYVVFADAARTVEVPTTGGVSVLVGAGGVVALPIYATASLPGGGLLPGTYSDSVQITLTW